MFLFVYDFLASWKGEEEKKAFLAVFWRNHQKVLEQEIPSEYPQNNAEVYFCWDLVAYWRWGLGWAHTHSWVQNEVILLHNTM